MNPDDLKQILAALTSADVREFALRTGSFDLSLKRGPQAVNAAVTAPSGPAAFQSPSGPTPQALASSAETSAPVSAEPAAVATVAAAAEPTAAAAPAASKGTPVKAPIVGTFYASSSPDAPPYVKVGDTVAAGQVLCIIEAMKLMNEIEAEQGGTVREILVKNAEPVEYGQTLFIIE
ncbi:acetyl-CoA carboxylase biotin carboxyl carrier protein [Deinococcus sp. KSM4-11]|uniref:acetyl-CoA carboxylase biotin carboxyl carrier protein n=1 Tax=Deinococcus sp. KSM4-11 TaxID=2568654 RepID=UPI0010A35E82|nr:acetyl-CoA carboxylase biotin carboxyl carrier protein [Deinococcus sp. KSM4-11]THF86812.1 acetyl-CoA carboxylase biotin carboxyl carrier protein [Deinococcus sp. KSM4-11]